MVLHRTFAQDSNTSSSIKSSGLQDESVSALFPLEDTKVDGTKPANETVLI